MTLTHRLSGSSLPANSGNVASFPGGKLGLWSAKMRSHEGVIDISVIDVLLHDSYRLDESCLSQARQPSNR
jgi:hypothetical protein